ncbi:hypothetical protein Catovirus_1_316 [Catovirus CTV1]|uniref:Uncharacterized protein n=1 Tax=Catovirus CTV1 TaxID=1977631 RepID=A0A1V0S977_9VIRU|nr:hypothetical protein Catovirus_1_316 [Catovirus CTV1]
MPPKRKIQAQTETNNDAVEQKNNSENENELLESTKKPLVMVKYSANDSDRTQLAQAINNLTIKSEQFLEAMKSFDTFRENIAQLDIQIETKKKEHKALIDDLELNYVNKNKNLDGEYKELNKQLHSKYNELNKKLESEYQDKTRTLQNDFKNTQIELKQKMTEHKLKACEEIAKEQNMTVIKNEDHKTLLSNVQKANHDLEDLKKSFNDQCNSIRNEEKTKYQLQLKQEVTTLELNHKANIAELKAQVEQQKKEIDVLQKTIENLKHEIAEQRTLTKEVAQASSKSQINQRFGKDN